MTKIILALILVVLLALSAGLVAGMALHSAPRSAAHQARTPLAEELQLSDAQVQEMRQIWEGVRDKVDAAFVDAMSLQKDRDSALFALLDDGQKTKFAAIQKDYAERLAKLKQQRDATFDLAVKQTEQILTDPQRKRYREILANRLDRKSGDALDWLPAPAPSPEPAPAAAPAAGEQE